MARSSKRGPAGGAATAEAGWAALTWDDLEGWAGSGSVARGRAYRRSGRVRDLGATDDGALLATVEGTEPYATTVALMPSPRRGRPTLESSCTCPVGVACKHAVAVVAEYLHALAEGRHVPVAGEDDPRWVELAEAGPDLGAYPDEFIYVHEHECVMTPARRRGAGRRAGAPRTEWDDRIQRLIRGMAREELAELAWSLVRRSPEAYEEFRERIALQDEDAGRIAAEARREIRRVTAEPAWRNGWTGEGSTPDYTRARRRLERLLELGHADEVVALGRELIERGMAQVAGAHDEGETLAALRECLPVVFRAVLESSLPGPERLIFAIDAELADDYDVIGEASAAVLDAYGRPEDWSAVADILMRRLKELPAQAGSRGEDFRRSYGRDRLTGWIAEALERAGRGEEVRALYESEARATQSYDRLVKFLLERRRYDDAGRWAREGIAATVQELPGIAAHLAEDLCELARRHKQWDVVAAHAAHAFFDEHPDATSFEALMEAARKAGVEGPVRAAALRFLETGVPPYRLVAPRAAKAPAAKGKRAGAKRPAPPRLEVDPAWPLPVPDELVLLLGRPGRRGLDEAPRPRLDVLLDMAIAAGHPDEVLRWYDAMLAAPKTSDPWGDSHAHGLPAAAGRVAAAVADACPERAIAIYRAALDAQLPHADPSSYEAAAGYLRKLRPLYEALGRAGEWAALVASIREQYRNRPRFLEALDSLEGRTIVESARPRRR